MPRPLNLDPARRWRRAAVLVAAAVAGLSLAALAAIAVAKSFTLKVAKNAPVTNITATSPTVKHEAIAVTSNGFAVYTLSGETAHKFKCTSAQCFMFWPPVKEASSKGLAAAPGIKGKLGVVHRMGFTQLTLAGRPLYHFMPDKKKNAANGDGVVSFGGTWHVITASTSGHTHNSPTTPSTQPTTTNPYPMGY
jgi:predicted lipoprotein with Yx(FWY)xxD motif